MNLINQYLIKYVFSPIIWIYIFVLLKDTIGIQWYTALLTAFACMQVTNLLFNLLLMKYGILFPTDVTYYTYDDFREKVNNVILVSVTTLCIVIFVIFWNMNKTSLMLCIVIVCVAMLGSVHSNISYFAIYGEPLNVLRTIVYTIVNTICIFIVVDYLYYNLSINLMGLLIPVIVYVYLVVRILLKYIYKLDDEEEDERFKIY